ncbi:MAG: sensor histidine kinase [Cyclobacteriaceae bacterium]
MIKEYLTIVILLFSIFCFAQNSTDQLDSIRALYEKSDTKQHAEILISAGKILIKTNLDSSKLVFERAFEESLNKKDKVASLAHLGRNHTYLGGYQSADSILNRSLDLLDFENYDLQTTLINNFGINHFYQGNYDEAGEKFEEYYQLALDEKNNEDLSKSLNNLGVIYKYAGNYEKALVWLLKSVQLDERLQDEASLAQSLNNVAMVHSDMKNFPLAKSYYKKSLRIKEKVGDLRGAYSAYNNLGVLFKNTSIFDSALLYLEKSLLIAKEINYHKGMQDSYSSLTVVNNTLGRHKEALKTGKLALDMAKDANDEEGLASGLLNYGDSYRLDGNVVLGEKYISEGLAQSLKIANKNFVKDAYLMMSELNEQKGNFKKAYTFHRKHKALSDSLLNQGSSDKIAELQTQYETEKKERQIALQQVQLERQQAKIDKNKILVSSLAAILVFLILTGVLWRNRMILKREKLLEQEKLKIREMQIEAAIASQESERKRFARDLHDGFGQMISVLNLNLKSLEKGTSSKEEVFENSSKVLDEMYKELKGICFNLMPETLIKSGVVDAIKEFASRINNAGRIFVEVDTFGITERLQDLQEISIYRITQEWINNILKYSDAEKVTISLTKDSEEVTLLIEDNGTGFSKEVLTLGKGNGWKNMNSRANLIKGELELDTRSGVRGSTLIVNVPVAVEKPSELAVIEE